MKPRCERCNTPLVARLYHAAPEIHMVGGKLNTLWWNCPAVSPPAGSDNEEWQEYLAHTFRAVRPEEATP